MKSGLLLLTIDMRMGSPFSVTQKARYYNITPAEGSQFFWLCWGQKGGGPLLPFLKRSATPLYGEGTSMNRTHSRGIKEPLHWFVLEAVLLICLPMNECIGPVSRSCGQSHSRPVLTGLMLFPQNSVH